MSEPAMLADHIDQQTDAIIAVWKATVERVGDVPEAERLSHVEFVDHVPELLDRIADRLRGHAADPGREGRKHGQVRWRQGYDIAEVINEFGHLRTALTRSTTEFARAHRWNVDRLQAAIEAINDVLDDAAAESVHQFQDDSRAEMRETLAEVKRRQVAIEDAWITAKQEKSKLRTILGHLPAAVWVVDAEGKVEGGNHKAERLQGYPHEEAGSAAADANRVAPYFPAFRLDGTPLPDDERPIRRALRGETVTLFELIWVIGGERRTMSINAAPLTNATGKVVGAVSVVLDITLRKQIEADLAVSEARFRTIAEDSPVMIWRTDADGRCDFVNRAGLDFRGPGIEPTRGEGWTGGVHPDDRQRVLALFRDSVARREPFELNYRLLRNDGQYRWVDDRGTPYHDDRGTFLGYLGSCLDINDRVELEAALEQQRIVAEEASRHKTRLVSALSHDARTPLNAVVLAAQLLEIHFDGDGHDPEVKHCLTTIRHSVRNVLDLLGDLLNLSKIDAGAQPPEITRFPLELCLAECLASIEPQARVKGLDVRLDLGPLEGTSLETDRSKLKQIISNMLSNALRYTDRGHIRIFGEKTDEQIRISVEDTGVGIAPADQTRIFDEYEVLDNPKRIEGEGTGLGLAICRRLASLLKGEINLRSAPRVGSTFTLVLPSSVLTLSLPFTEPENIFEAPTTDQGTILVAEDHPDSRQTLARVLRRMGYRVLEASNGQDALDLAAREPLFAVLMDVNMPVMDGIEATLSLRANARTRGVPIFALTGDVTTGNQNRIGEAGVDGYLEKPVTWDALRQALGTLPRPPSD